jgi:hypothetical protein
MVIKTSQDADVAGRFEALLAETGAKDRTNIEKHLAACDAERDPQHAMLWRRLVVTLRQLAPMPMVTIGSQVVRFFIADGKYRMQVFAIEDNRDGMVSIYLPNVMAKAVREKLVVKKGEQYVVAGAPNHRLRIQAIDPNDPPDPPDHIKHMTGWNRKAVKSTLLTSDAGSPIVDAMERLCALAAEQWVTPDRAKRKRS